MSTLGRVVAKQAFFFMAFLALVTSIDLYANPYFIPHLVPKDPPLLERLAREFSAIPTSRGALRTTHADVVRIDIDWIESSDSFEFKSAFIEQSGTDYLYLKSQHYPLQGSFIGILEDSSGQKTYSALGTGQEFRRLSRGLAFRFPASKGRSKFTLIAEDPVTGDMKERLNVTIEPTTLSFVVLDDSLDVRMIKQATASPIVKLVVYAEGYQESGSGRFFDSAKKIAASFADSNLPTFANMEITAVFAPSKSPLGPARSLGIPVPERDSFLGLYYPYWNNFGRWYHVVYPTRYQKYRNALAQVPYDYPVALIDSNEYWGVGNYLELTAIPAGSQSFRYLLLHEFGHFLGLNEEYEGGGRTELEFAPEITEPWSPNITFAPERENLKWKSHIASNTPLPTPRSAWNTNQNGPLGAYQGGYADSAAGKSYKPGYACIMERHPQYCEVCRHAIIKDFFSALTSQPR
jgi:hypothetical protein